MTQNRFLPVPLRPRQDGWTPDKQWRFVEALAESGSMTHAVRAVGMSARSAYRLRDHPEGGAFRAAWDAAMAQVWGKLELVALDRAINGERETVEHDSGLVAERHRPCSPKLLIHLLTMHERQQAMARAERIAAHKRAMAEADLARFRAQGAAGRGGRGKRAAPPVALLPPPVLLDDKAADAAAVLAFRDLAAGFAAHPAMDDAILPEITAPWAGDATVIRPRSAEGALDTTRALIDAVEPEYDRFRPHASYTADSI